MVTFAKREKWMEILATWISVNGVSEVCQTGGGGGVTFDFTELGV
jgi:hypothetical protein